MWVKTLYNVLKTSEAMLKLHQKSNSVRNKSKGNRIFSLEGFHLHFSPNGGSGVTCLWGFRLHLQVLGITTTIEGVCVSPASKEQIFLLCVKVVTNKDFSSMKRKARASDRDTGKRIKATKSLVCSAWCSPFDRQFDRSAVMQKCNNTSAFREFLWGSEYTSFSVRFQNIRYLFLVNISDVTGIEFWDLLFDKSAEQSPRRWHCNPRQNNGRKW